MLSKIRNYLHFDAKKVSFFRFGTKTVKQSDTKNRVWQRNRNVEEKATNFLSFKAKKILIFRFVSLLKI
jgi:hypothetical protein